MRELRANVIDPALPLASHPGPGYSAGAFHFVAILSEERESWVEASGIVNADSLTDRYVTSMYWCGAFLLPTTAQPRSSRRQRADTAQQMVLLSPPCLDLLAPLASSVKAGVSRA